MNGTFVGFTPAAGPSPFSEFADCERARILGNVSLRLTGRQMQIIVLRYGDDLSFIEIAEALGVSKVTVWKMHQRILTILRIELAGRGIGSLRQI